MARSKADILKEFVNSLLDEGDILDPAVTKMKKSGKKRAVAYIHTDDGKKFRLLIFEQ